MFKKKLLLAGTAAVLTFSLSVFPAFAHGHGQHGGHHGNGMTQALPSNSYNTDAVGNNDINAGLSADTNVTADTNPDAGTTAVSNAYPVCTFEGCTETGRHLHDGSYYCGYHHNGGYCDGSCIGSSPAVGNSPAANNPPAAAGYNYGRRYGCHRSYARKMVYCH